MPTDGSITDVLIESGLSQYEAEVFLSVLELADASVTEIADSCAVPRSRVYDVLDSLERQGYLQTYERGALRAQVSDPAGVTQYLEAKSKRFSTVADEIEEIWQQPQVPQSNVRAFENYDSIIDEAKERLTEAENLIHLAVSPKELDMLADTLASAYEENVTIRISIQDPEGESNESDGLKSLYPEIATEVKDCTSIVPFIALIDGRIAVYGVDSGRGNEYGITVADHILSSILHWYFQVQLWEPWSTIYSSSDRDETIYASIRELIRDLESVRESQEEIVVRVEGIETKTGDSVDITGPIREMLHTGTDQTSPFTQPFIQAAIVVSDGEQEYTIGGYGAIVEDVRATRISVISME